MSSLVSRITFEAGRLDVLVHAAGVMSVMHKDFPAVTDASSIDEVQKTMLSESEAGWATQFAVNVTSPYFLTAACLVLLKKSGEYWAEAGKHASTERQLEQGGVRNGAEEEQPKDPAEDAPQQPTRTAQVITITGISGYFRSMAACMGYAASKAGTVHLVKTLSTVLAMSDIRFVHLPPGLAKKIPKLTHWFLFTDQNAIAPGSKFHPASLIPPPPPRQTLGNQSSLPHRDDGRKRPLGRPQREPSWQGGQEQGPAGPRWQPPGYCRGRVVLVRARRVLRERVDVDH